MSWSEVAKVFCLPALISAVVSMIVIVLHENASHKR